MSEAAQQQQEAGQQQIEARPQGLEIDPARLQYAMDGIRSEQNLTVGIVVGAVAALIGAAIWALVTVTTGFQIGWMAVGVGFLVGMAIRKFGKGVDKPFSVAGAVLALFGCLVGNLLAVCAMVSAQLEVPFLQVLAQLDLTVIRELMVSTFSTIDILFYGIAVYEGYRLSIRQITQQELAEFIPELRPEPVVGQNT